MFVPETIYILNYGEANIEYVFEENYFNFSIIMIFMFTIGQSLLPIVANAQELNTAGIVDSFKIDKTDLLSGNRLKSL